MRPLTNTGNYISNRIGKAIADYNLIEDKDRILVAVSGGKDSLALLKLLIERQKWAPIRYELIAMHVETDFRCAGCVHTDRLKKFFDEIGIKSVFKKIKISQKGEEGKIGGKKEGEGNGREEKDKDREGKVGIDKGESEKGRGTSCFWCSWNRRKALFLAAEKLGCNKIAFGHHKDDIVETLLLNIFYQGAFAAMNPRQELFGGKIALIRPLCYVEEENMRKFAVESGFPPQVCRCPNADTSKRRLMKNIISGLEKDCPHVRTNIFRSVLRVKEEYINLAPIKK
ncbi:MAG: ATP-binding protein [Candidatus Omnitrophota bacterium]|nr:ATP-binding protein [Candidatus Omnitrophota bacterium]